MSLTPCNCSLWCFRRDTYLFTIVVKNKETGFGIPVAFLLTKTQKWELLKEWLCQLKAKMDQLCAEPYFPTAVITDQGTNEINAIQYAFDFKPRIFYCAWHILQAWERNFTKEKLGMDNISIAKKKERKDRVSETFLTSL